MISRISFVFVVASTTSRCFLFFVLTLALSFSFSINLSGTIFAQEKANADVEALMKNGLPFDLPTTLGGEDEDTDVDKSKSVKLAGALKRQLDEWVIPAIAHQRPWVLYEVATPIIEKASSEKLSAIEDYVASKGIDSFQSTYVSAKMDRIEQGMENPHVKQPLPITLFTLKGIDKRVQQFLSDVRRHEIMQDPIEVPERWQESRDLFWKIHVYKNGFANNKPLMKYAEDIVNSSKRLLEKSESNGNTSILFELERTASDLASIHHDLVEREAELRLKRFEQSHDLLVGDEKDFEKKLIAAMSIELDGEVLLPFLANQTKGSFVRPALNRDNLSADIHNKIQAVRKLHPKLTEKAFMFRSGLHSWLRGRYGRGPLANGLLKSPEAMKSVAAMTALYMPSNRPKPISQFHDAKTSSEGYDRRHYYTWNVEYRPLVEENQTKSVSIGAWKEQNFFW